MGAADAQTRALHMQCLETWRLIERLEAHAASLSENAEKNAVINAGENAGNNAEKNAGDNAEKNPVDNVAKSAVVDAVTELNERIAGDEELQRVLVITQWLEASERERRARHPQPDEVSSRPEVVVFVKRVGYLNVYEHVKAR